jgi:two-component sensor histidine kinase
VTDNGKGIKEQRPGLGLRLIAALAIQLGGGMQIHSLDPGARLAVRFPAG